MNTKRILPEPLGAKDNLVLKLDRESARILSQVITGHSTLNEHLHKMGLTSSPLCSKCRKANKTRDHFLMECEAFERLRYMELGKSNLSQEDLKDLSLKKILAFIKAQKGLM